MKGNQGSSSKNVTRPGYRNGAPNRGASAKAASQIGQSLGTHITEKRKELNYGDVAKPLFRGGPAIASELGNARAAATKCAPGGSRSVARTGSQGRH